MTSTLRGVDGFDSSIKFPRKNKIINGNFDIWQRGVSQTSNGYGSDDRWINDSGGTTKIHSRQSFTLGQAEVPGNPTYFSRTVVTSVAGSSNYCLKYQKIEDVIDFSEQPITISFWAKADSNKAISFELKQNFGTGGSPSNEVNSIGITKIFLTTTWTKYSTTINIPSILNKTLGINNNHYLAVIFWFDSGSSYNDRTNDLGQQSGTFDIAQVQLEKGVTDTNFEQKMPGEELKLCQRYYEKGLMYALMSVGIGNNLKRSFVASGNNFLIEKRTEPILVYWSYTGNVVWSVSGYSSGTVYSLDHVFTEFLINKYGIYGFVHTNAEMATNTEAVIAKWEADAEL